MKLKNYHHLQNAISLAAIIGLEYFISVSSFLWALTILLVAVVVLFIARKSVTEVVFDERDNNLRGQSFLMAAYTFAFLVVVTIIMLLLGPVSKEEYQIISVTLIVSLVIIFGVQRLYYIYYQKFAHLEKKGIYIALGIIMILIILVGMLRFFSGEDDWICQNGQWVKHGFPESSAPTTECK